jgi:hypothetical protein
MKLQLKKETLKVLADDKLDEVRGAAVGTPIIACCAYSATALKSCNGSVSCPVVAEPVPTEP